jgi:2-polyprenyl-3-methyl-5-hydroxy-6-metoxy-1,4-benzoquinol methylase
MRDGEKIMNEQKQDVEWNRRIFDVVQDWGRMGEEWSDAWGGSKSQWYGSILPRIHAFIPAKKILEIAPGFGRWTKFLISNCDTYIGVDLAQKCVDHCKKAFSGFDHADFYIGNGYDLTMVESDSSDFVFSFDSLVHVEIDVIKSYIQEVLRVLTIDGIAFIHHSNALDADHKEAAYHRRALSVSADLFRAEVLAQNGCVLLQEKNVWVSQSLIDCFTVFRRGRCEIEPVVIENYDFTCEAAYIKTNHSPYLCITRK